MRYQIMVTDTFSGEANYSWAHRYEIEAPEDISRSALIRRAKKAAGWTGWPCTVEVWADDIALRPRDGSCVIMFITVVP